MTKLKLISVLFYYLVDGIDNLNGKASSYETSAGVAQDIAKHGKISYINRNEEDEMVRGELYFV